MEALRERELSEASVHELESELLVVPGRLRESSAVAEAGAGPRAPVADR